MRNEIDARVEGDTQEQKRGHAERGDASLGGRWRRLPHVS